MKSARTLAMVLLLLVFLGSGCASLSPSAANEPTWEQEMHQDNQPKSQLDQAHDLAVSNFISGTLTVVAYVLQGFF